MNKIFLKGVDTLSVMSDTKFVTMPQTVLHNLQKKIQTTKFLMLKMLYVFYSYEIEAPAIH